MWVEKEYCWDSRKELRQKTDTEYARDLQNFIGDKHIKAIYIDPSAASFIQECRRQGIYNIRTADNRVLDGIRHTTNLLANGTLKICSECTGLIREFQSYVWDDKAAMRGVDKPQKDNDHILDGLRYGLMHWYSIGTTNRESNISELNRRNALRI
jgi:phage terminase large subunit